MTVREFYEEKEKRDIQNTIAAAKYLDEDTKEEMYEVLISEAKKQKWYFVDPDDPKWGNPAPSVKKSNLRKAEIKAMIDDMEKRGIKITYKDGTKNKGARKAPITKAKAFESNVKEYEGTLKGKKSVVWWKVFY